MTSARIIFCTERHARCTGTATAQDMLQHAALPASLTAGMRNANVRMKSVHLVPPDSAVPVCQDLTRQTITPAKELDQLPAQAQALRHQTLASISRAMDMGTAFLMATVTNATATLVGTAKHVMMPQGVTIIPTVVTGAVLPTVVVTHVTAILATAARLAVTQQAAMMSRVSTAGSVPQLGTIIRVPVLALVTPG